LAGMILTSSRGLRQDIQQDIARLRADMKQLSDRVARLEHSQAKLEGLLEGLREAITGRATAS
jgi:cell division protein FtsB